MNPWLSRGSLIQKKNNLRCIIILSHLFSITYSLIHRLPSVNTKIIPSIYIYIYIYEQISNKYAQYKLTQAEETMYFVCLLFNGLLTILFHLFKSPLCTLLSPCIIYFCYLRKKKRKRDDQTASNGS